MRSAAVLGADLSPFFDHFCGKRRGFFTARFAEAEVDGDGDLGLHRLDFGEVSGGGERESAEPNVVVDLRL